MKTLELCAEELSELMEAVNHHSLYTQIHTLADLRIFMECHVFAVWDFMCLLKELQRRLVSTQAPWFPPLDAQSAHLINSILVEEEGDLSEDGQRYLCHFDLYLAAMLQIGADTQAIQHFLRGLKRGHSLETYIQQAGLPPPVPQFIQTTFSFFNLSTPALAAAFVYGREAITGKMFSPLIKQLTGALPADQQDQLSGFIYYCQRHIELDQADHLPKALAMLINLINLDSQDNAEVIQTARRALTARLEFLTGIECMINTACRCMPNAQIKK